VLIMVGYLVNGGTIAEVETDAFGRAAEPGRGACRTAFGERRIILEGGRCATASIGSSATTEIRGARPRSASASIRNSGMTLLYMYD
jgi:hypothetical protein